MNGSRFEPRWRKEIFSSPHPSTLALWHSQPPVQWKPGLFAGCKADGVRRSTTFPSLCPLGTLRGDLYLYYWQRSKHLVFNRSDAARGASVSYSAISHASYSNMIVQQFAQLLTWICLTAVGYVRSDASDLTLAHSHSHKWHHAAAAMPVNVLRNSYNTRPMLCARITCYVSYNTRLLLCARIFFFSISLTVQSVTSLTALFHS
jgi:hypothetical protein